MEGSGKSDATKPSMLTVRTSEQIFRVHHLRQQKLPLMSESRRNLDTPEFPIQYGRPRLSAVSENITLSVSHSARF